MRFKQYLNENSWFKGSKVNRGKKPLTLYRGISKTVEDRHASAALGIFATPNLNTAKAYAGGSGKLLKVYMKIVNPYYMEYDEIQEIENKQDAIKLKKELMKKGHDGIFLKPMKGTGAMPTAVSEYIAFNKNQVKEVE